MRFLRALNVRAISRDRRQHLDVLPSRVHTRVHARARVHTHAFPRTRSVFICMGTFDT